MELGPVVWSGLRVCMQLLGPRSPSCHRGGDGHPLPQFWWPVASGCGLVCRAQKVTCVLLLLFLQRAQEWLI